MALAARHRADLRRGRRGDRGRRPHHRALRPRRRPRRIAPIPSLLLTSAVHHHLIRSRDPHPDRPRRRVRRRARGAPRRAAASATAPPRSTRTWPSSRSSDLIATGDLPASPVEKAQQNLIKALGKGVLKVMSKMGISTVASYTGAQVFEAIGLSSELVDQLLHRHREPARGRRARRASPPRSPPATPAPTRTTRPRSPTAASRSAASTSGAARASSHLFNPETVFKLQHATRDQARRTSSATTPPRSTSSPAQAGTLRGLFKLREGVRPPVPIEEVEPVSEIVKRFATGAMSYGSISAEAHETLAIAMNRLGGKSNTGEGGEDVERFTPMPNGDSQALRDQAGRQRPVRRDQRVPDQRRRHPDQDGAGRQARRGRPAARPQGLPVDRARPATRRRASA